VGPEVLDLGDFRVLGFRVSRFFFWIFLRKRCCGSPGFLIATVLLSVPEQENKLQVLLLLAIFVEEKNQTLEAS